MTSDLISMMYGMANDVDHGLVNVLRAASVGLEMHARKRKSNFVRGFYLATAKHTHRLAVDICLSVCPSVCLSVCLSNAQIVTKRDNRL